MFLLAEQTHTAAQALHTIIREGHEKTYFYHVLVIRCR